jgi:hypothetical protein
MRQKGLKYRRCLYLLPKAEKFKYLKRFLLTYAERKKPAEQAAQKAKVCKKRERKSQRPD